MRRHGSRGRWSAKLRQLLYSELAHKVFWIGIIFKAVDGILEAVGALVLIAVSRRSIIDFVYNFFQHELSQDPTDWLARHLLGLVYHFSASEKVFAIAYLLTHGLIKLVLVVSIWYSKLWAYPLAGIAFSAFVVYQMVRFAYTHSILMLVLTAIDLVIIALLWPEHKRLKAEIEQQNEDTKR